MKLVHIVAPLTLLGLAACVATPEQNTAVGALTGAAVGAAVSDKGDRTKGILAGAAAGAIAGTYLGRTNDPNKCYYRDASGNRFVANC